MRKERSEEKGREKNAEKKWVRKKERKRSENEKEEIRRRRMNMNDYVKTTKLELEERKHTEKGERKCKFINIWKQQEDGGNLKRGRNE